MDPRTFLPPSPVPTAEAPDLGAPAPGPPFDASRERPAVIAFLRHTGCPFSEATWLEIRDAAAREAGLDWLVVSHAPADATERWCAAVGSTDDVDLTFDEARALYAQWGLGRTTLKHFAGMRSIRGAATLARSGIRNRHPSGTRWQTAGTFAVDAAGIVRWRHLPTHAGDMPDIAAAVGALNRMAS